MLKEADAIIREEIDAYNERLFRETGERNSEHSAWQYFGVLPDVKSVGVMGDERTYQHPIIVRAVESSDAMTADWAKLPYGLLAKVAEVFSRTPDSCGHRQIAMALRAECGVRIADKSVLKMMREMGIRCGIRRETDYHRYNSFRGVVGPTFENVLVRDFAADGPGRCSARTSPSSSSCGTRRTSRRSTTSAARKSSPGT